MADAPAQPTPTPAPSPPAPAPPDPEPDSPTDVLLKVLGAIGTGIGILGFVTLFGGAILWVRANEAGLPANEAIAVVPNSVLVVTGASFLVPAVLIAAAVLAATFVVRLTFELPRERNERGRKSDARAKMRRAEAMGRAALPIQQAAAAARAILVSREEALETLKKGGGSQEAIDAQQSAVDEGRLETEKEEAAAEAAASAAAIAKANAEDLLAESEFHLERTPRQLKLELLVGAYWLFFFPVLFNGAIWSVGKGWALALVAIAAAATAISLFVNRETDKFVWFGLAAFVTVGIYLGTATYISTSRNAKLQPVAALRTGHEPVVGAYIADTASNLYVGTFREPGKPPRMVVIPREQVTELSIGPLLDPDLARKRALALAIEACEQQIEVPPTPPPADAAGAKTEGQTGGGATQATGSGTGAAVVKDACTEEQMKALSEAAA